MMKKTLLSLTLLASLMQAEELSTNDQGLYAGAGLGILATNKHGDAGLGLTLKAGVALDSVLKGFGLQAELNKSIIHPEYANNNNINILTTAAYATFDIEIPSTKLTLRPRIGLILPNLKDDIDSRNIILSSGFGATYAIEKNLRLYADYTVLAEEISNYSVGVEIKF